MKKLLIITLLTFVVSSVFAQDFRLRSYSSSYSFLNTQGKFGDLEKNEVSSSILIVITDYKITVYAKETGVYSIIAKGTPQKSTTGYYTDFKLLDADGILCIGKIYITELSTYHVFIEYQNVAFAYNCLQQ